MEFPEHLAHYNRYLWKSPNLIVVTGEADKIWQGRRAYHGSHAVTPEAAGPAELLNRLFAAAGLAAVSLAQRESWGWSVSLPGMEEGFFCGVEPEGLICGCVLENKKTQGLCVVQRQGEKSPMAQSHVTLITQDPVEAVERYFEEAEQTLIRIAVDDAGRGVLLRPMPGGTFEAVNGLSDALIIERIFGLAAGGDMQHLEEVLLFYACPCSPEKIQAMITSLPADQSAQLWGDLKRLEIACPRCGRYYEVAR
jgi:hypothetical protein